MHLSDKQSSASVYTVELCLYELEENRSNQSIARRGSERVAIGRNSWLRGHRRLLGDENVLCLDPGGGLDS